MLRVLLFCVCVCLFVLFVFVFLVVVRYVLFCVDVVLCFVNMSSSWYCAFVLRCCCVVLLLLCDIVFFVVWCLVCYCLSWSLYLFFFGGGLCMICFVLMLS